MELAKIKSELKKLRDLEDVLHKFLTHKQKYYEEVLTDLDSIISDLEDECDG